MGRETQVRGDAVALTPSLFLGDTLDFPHHLVLDDDVANVWNAVEFIQHGGTVLTPHSGQALLVMMKLGVSFDEGVAKIFDACHVLDRPVDITF